MLDEEQSEINAVNELKRADHLLFVTLKYTRSCEVIKSIILRLISAGDIAILDVLTYLYKKKKIKKIPLTPISRAEALKDYTKKIEILKFLELYFKLKFIDKAEYTKKEEFKKNVTLTVMQDDEALEINIEKVKEFYNRTNEFITYIKEEFK